MIGTFALIAILVGILAIYLIIKKTKNYKVKLREIEREIDDTTALLLYILSFFIPLAGFIVGAIYSSKEEEHYKHVGKNCLIFSTLNIVLVLFSYIIIASILFA